MAKKTDLSIVTIVVLGLLSSWCDVNNSRAAGQYPQLSGPLCGVDCVYRALRSIGNDQVVFEDLVEARYVSSVDGSKGQELATAIDDAGENASRCACS